MIDRVRAYTNTPISIAPLAFFRGAFGLLMLVSIIRFASHNWIQELYIDPPFLFSYYGFDFLPRPSVFWVYTLFVACGLSAIGIMLGLFYRWSALLFFGSFTYIELLDKANYLNHYYFVTLVALLLIFLPANRAFSIDLKLNRVEACGQVKRLNVLLIQLLIGGLYFMAGMAKLNSDWMLEALPMKIWLPAHNSLPLIGPLLDEAWLAYLFSWIGAFYDLSIPFLLYYAGTRKWAYISVILFHGLTALFFPIGMFPYMMICFSLIFFRAETLSFILTLGGRFKFIIQDASERLYQASRWIKVSRSAVTVIILLLLFVFPLRFLAYPPTVFWHEQGYRFSWRVMLMEKAGHCFFYVKDPEQKGELEINNRDFLTANQEKQMCTQPDMILQFAHLLDAHFQTEGVTDPQVRVEAWVTLNGRGSRLFIDPLRDLSKEKEGWMNKDWVIPYDSVLTVVDLKRMKKQLQD